MATSLSLGQVIGPPVGSLLAQHLGFAIAFDALALTAVMPAVLLIFFMPRTAHESSPGPLRTHYLRTEPAQDGLAP